MFCSDCGKTIDDDALICPKCGAVTKKGLLALKNQETTNQLNESTAQLDEPTETETAPSTSAENKNKETENNVVNSELTDVEKKHKALKFVAMIIGLAGSAVLIVSLLSDFCSYKTPQSGAIPVSMSDHLGILILVVVFLAGLSIVSSVLRRTALLIATGCITLVWAGYMIWTFQSISSSLEILGLLDVKIGIGVYLSFLAACLILFSGIVYVFAAKNAKTTTAEEKSNSKKKIEILISVCLGVLFVCGIVVIESLKNHDKSGAKYAVAQFMNDAILYNVDSMNSLLATDVNDKNGLMEAYTADTMRNAFLSSWGLDADDLNAESNAAVTETSILFGKYYLKNYKVESIAENFDDSYTVKVTASIIDMSTTYEQIQTESAAITSEYVDLNPEEITELYFELRTDRAVANYLSVKLFPNTCSIINSAIRSAGAKDTEFTFTLKKVDGSFKITEIDYMD